MAPSNPGRRKSVKTHPMVGWLREIGIAAELFGWGGLLLADWFWVGVPAIYLGFVALAADVWWGENLRQRKGWRIGVLGAIIALAAIFSWKIVFVSAPLSVSAYMIDGTYPVGQTIAGIAWRPEFTEVDVDINNPTDNPYDDLDVVLRPALPVAAINQKGNICPNMSFEDKNHATHHLIDIDFGTGNKAALPIILIATDAGYRIRCSRLPAHSAVSLVIALVDIKWVDCAISGRDAIDNIRSGCLIRLRYNDFSTYWVGLSNADAYLHRPTSSDVMEITKQYTVMHRSRSNSERLTVGGNLSIKRQ